MDILGDLDFIILFVGILPLYAINLGVVSLFAVSTFTFLAILVMDLPKHLAPITSVTPTLDYFHYLII